MFLQRVDDFNEIHEIVQAFPNMGTIKDIGDSEARITAKVLGCQRKDFYVEFDYYFLLCLKLEKIQVCYGRVFIRSR